jgi:hypothetical protein
MTKLNLIPYSYEAWKLRGCKPRDLYIQCVTPADNGANLTGRLGWAQEMEVEVTDGPTGKLKIINCSLVKEGNRIHINIHTGISTFGRHQLFLIQETTNESQS